MEKENTYEDFIFDKYDALLSVETNGKGNRLIGRIGERTTNSKDVPLYIFSNDTDMGMDKKCGETTKKQSELESIIGENEFVVVNNEKKVFLVRDILISRIIANNGNLGNLDNWLKSIGFESILRDYIEEGEKLEDYVSFITEETTRKKPENYPLKNRRFDLSYDFVEFVFLLKQKIENKRDDKVAQTIGKIIFGENYLINNSNKLNNSNESLESKRKRLLLLAKAKVIAMKL